MVHKTTPVEVEKGAREAEEIIRVIFAFFGFLVEIVVARRSGRSITQPRSNTPSGSPTLEYKCAVCDIEEEKTEAF
ncbi:hypothetical protein BOTBODRAFT_52393 [Botryobasidium botryosum FD-172 SS1]|uniref:Uncharacterized protein n=1 Tax=Botryobasidium botryosum (strain FD-172 SS1) TaxID=930990 RepID=A0A067MRX9_BOTB1|nr:hypothetical protein BOTBODRAFT_52393 [Botryobasidium botryosum FD-172 SS1]